MSIREYDIAVIGGSLSARIAATLLAKTGRKILFLRRREAMAPTWFHSSLFLEKLLATLGGRSCFVAPLPIQVISRQARITLHPDIPLEEELKRELGEAADMTIQFLTELNMLGTQLEEVLWENGGLIWPSLKGSARFKFLCLARKVKTSDINTPLTSLLGKLPTVARLLLTDLFQGLALMPLDQISRGRGALLWAQATCPEQLQEPDFSQMLSKRLEQFRGAKGDLEELASLECEGSRWTGGAFKEGGRFRATTFLLGDVRWRDRFTALPSKDLPTVTPFDQYQLGDLAGQLSPLLESRVICGGKFPLRLTIEEQSMQIPGQVIVAGRPSQEQLRQQLEKVLPFARYNLTLNSANAKMPEGVSTPLPLLEYLPLKLSDNLFCADSNAILPGLGAAGATLLGWTLAEHLAEGKS